MSGTWRARHFDREVIPERRMHAKGSGASATSPSPRYYQNIPGPRSSPKSGRKPNASPFHGGRERGAADAERDIRALPMKFYTGRKLGPRGQQHARILLRDPSSSPTQPRVKAIPARTCAAQKTTGTSGPRCRGAAPVTIVMSDAAFLLLPPHARIGSHTFSFINGKMSGTGQVHLRTQQGIKT